jgi:hypothetical protein
MVDFEALTLSPIITTLGTAVTFTPNGDDPEELTGVFEKSYQAVTPDGGVVVQSTQPRLLIKLSDVSRLPAAADTFTVSGTDYEVIESQEDGQGGVLVYLHKV